MSDQVLLEGIEELERALRGAESWVRQQRLVSPVDASENVSAALDELALVRWGLDARATARRSLDDFGTREGQANRPAPQELLASAPGPAPDDPAYVRLSVLQAYMATVWSTYELLEKVVVMFLPRVDPATAESGGGKRKESKSNDSKKKPGDAGDAAKSDQDKERKALKSLLPKRDWCLYDLHAVLLGGYGRPVALSYAVRNLVVHEALGAGRDLFDGETLALSEDGKRSLERKAGHEFFLPAQVRTRRPGLDLGAHLKDWHDDVDEMFSEALSQAAERVALAGRVRASSPLAF